MAENASKLMTGMKAQIQEVQKTPSRINANTGPPLPPLHLGISFFKS